MSDEAEDLNDALESGELPPGWVLTATIVEGRYVIAVSALGRTMTKWDTVALVASVASALSVPREEGIVEAFHKQDDVRSLALLDQVAEFVKDGLNQPPPQD